MTYQEIFNKVVAHADKQKEQCQRKFDGLCLYRGPNGKSCFIGALIKDEDYKEEMENKSVSRLFTNKLLPRDYFGENIELGFLEELQDIHDINSPNEWQSRFERFAKKYDLSF